MSTPSTQPSQSLFDIIVIGGGINGVGIANDAAGRGLSVLLCEQADLASGTSSASSGLIHGGLRYLSTFEFRLVHHALKERDILQKNAPHIICAQRFILPYRPQLQPRWLLRLGLWLYDHLGGQSSLPQSQAINLANSDEGQPLVATKHGFSYFDCRVDDARLVILNAISAANHHAQILTRHRFIDAIRHPNHWEVTLKHAQETVKVQSKVLVNAAGPWVTDVLQQLKCQSDTHMALVKGSHIVVPRLYPGEQAYILQTEDDRVVFVIPYLETMTLIGTTDVTYTGDPADAKITLDEINYLCNCVNHYFKQKTQPENVIWHYSGVRPLQANYQNNPSKITRDYQLELDFNLDQAPLLTIFGGKITTYRILAEQALAKLKPFFHQCGKPWTTHASLPGGDIEQANIEEFIETMQCCFSWLNTKLVYRYSHTYGRLMQKLLKNCQKMSDLGQHFGHQLYQREVEYLIQHEWAQTADDILWRRTKLGLLFTSQQIEKLNAWIKQYHSSKY